MESPVLGPSHVLRFEESDVLGTIGCLSLRSISGTETRQEA